MGLMHWSWADYLVLSHIATSAVTMLVCLARRPAVPARLAQARGLLRIFGTYAYWVTRPMLQAIHLLRISPTGLTGIGLLLGGVCAVACAAQQWGLAGLALLWSGICDMLDGELARSGQRASPAGAFLDSVCDRICEVAVFVGIAYVMPSRAMELVTAVAMGSSLMVSYTRARGEGLNMACPGGGMERPGRLVVLMLCMLFGQVFFQPYALDWVQAAVTAVAVGATGTALMRTLALYQLLARAHAQASATAAAHPTEDRTAHASLHRNVVRSQS